MAERRERPLEPTACITDDPSPLLFVVLLLCISIDHQQNTQSYHRTNALAREIATIWPHAVFQTSCLVIFYIVHLQLGTWFSLTLYPQRSPKFRRGIFSNHAEEHWWCVFQTEFIKFNPQFDHMSGDGVQNTNRIIFGGHVGIPTSQDVCVNLLRL